MPNSRKGFPWRFSAKQAASPRTPLQVVVLGQQVDQARQKGEQVSQAVLLPGCSSSEARSAWCSIQCCLPCLGKHTAERACQATQRQLSQGHTREQTVRHLIHKRKSYVCVSLVLLTQHQTHLFSFFSVRDKLTQAFLLLRAYQSKVCLMRLCSCFCKCSGARSFLNIRTKGLQARSVRTSLRLDWHGSANDCVCLERRWRLILRHRKSPLCQLAVMQRVAVVLAALAQASRSILPMIGIMRPVMHAHALALNRQHPHTCLIPVVRLRQYFSRSEAAGLRLHLLAGHCVRQRQLYQQHHNSTGPLILP